MTHLLLRVVPVLLLACCGAAASAQTARVQAELLADQTAVSAGQPFRVGVRLRMQPGWHVYWLNPGESGLPTQVKLRVPEGWTVGAVRFPVPLTFVQPGDVIGYGYTDEVVLIAQVTPPKELDGDSVTLAAEVSWLACKEVCIPGRQTLSLELPVGGASAPANEALFQRWTPRLPVSPDEAKVSVRQSLQQHEGTGNGRLELTWTDPPAEARLLSIPGDAVEVSDIEIQTEGKLMRITYRLRVLGGQKIADATLPLVLAYRSAPDAPWRGIALEQALRH